MRISPYITVFISQISGIIVMVAISTTERLVIIWSRVTFVTLAPGAIMSSAENGEIQGVMLGKVSGTPAGVSRMTGLAVS